MRFVQSGRVQDASVGTRDELVRQMGPIVECQSRPAIGAMRGLPSSAHVQHAADKERIESKGDDRCRTRQEKRTTEALTRQKL